MGVSLEVEDIIVQFFSDELVLLKALISDVENRVLVGRLVVHVEHYVRLRNRNNRGDVPGLRLNPIFSNRNVHVGGIALEVLHGAERGQVSDGFRLERVSVIALEIATHDAVLKGAGVVLLRLDDLAAELHALEALRGEGVDVNRPRMHQNAHCVAIRGIGIRPVDVSFEQLGIVPLDVLRSNDNLDLPYGECTVWLAN